MDEYGRSMSGYGSSTGGFAKFLLFCTFVVAIGALFAFWPSQYQYYNAQGGILVRVNRYSGATEQYLDGVGWVVPKRAVDASGNPNPSDKTTREDGAPTPTPSQREEVGKPTSTPTKRK